MNSILKKIVYDRITEVQKKFDENCQLIIFNLAGNDIETILCNSALDSEFRKILKDLKKNHDLNAFYYFKSKIDEATGSCIANMSMACFINELFPPLNKFFIESTKTYFLYLIIEYKNHIKVNIDSEVIEKIETLFDQFSVKNKTISTTYNKNSEILFHAIYQNIYEAYDRNNDKYSKYERVDKQLFESFESPMKIKNFINEINQFVRNITDVNAILDYVEFQMQSSSELKSLREEYIVIKNFIECHHINKNQDIFLGNNTEQWDAKIKLKTEDLILEITQAVPSDEHLTREHLTLYGEGHKGFSLKLRTKHQEGLNEFPHKIIEAIERKHKKNYDDNRILIVVVLSEFAYEEENIIKYWIRTLSQNTTKGKFKEVWLSIDTSIFYKLF